MADEDEFSGHDNEMGILLISFTSKKLTRVSYLTSCTKKAFNHLWFMFTQAPIFQYFDLEHNI